MGGEMLISSSLPPKPQKPTGQHPLNTQSTPCQHAVNTQYTSYTPALNKGLTRGILGLKGCLLRRKNELFKEW